MASETHRAIDAVWRIESRGHRRSHADRTRVGSPKSWRRTRSSSRSKMWPSRASGQPGAWAHGRGEAPRDRPSAPKQAPRTEAQELGRELEARQEAAVADLDNAIDDDIGDDLLRLVFIACHPVLSTEARIALTLRLLGGLTTDEIARAFLVSESTIAQRIVRAKRTLAAARVPFEVPRGDERAARLSSVLEVIYLVFNEGYSATAGDDWLRLRCARTRSGSAGFSPNSSPWSPKSTASSRSWRFRRRGRGGRLREGRADPAARPGSQPLDQLLIRRGSPRSPAPNDRWARSVYAIQAAIAA